MSHGGAAARSPRHDAPGPDEPHAAARATCARRHDGRCPRRPALASRRASAKVAGRGKAPAHALPRRGGEGPTRRRPPRPSYVAHTNGPLARPQPKRVSGRQPPAGALSPTSNRRPGGKPSGAVRRARARARAPQTSSQGFQIPGAQVRSHAMWSASALLRTIDEARLALLMHAAINAARPPFHKSVPRPAPSRAKAGVDPFTLVARICTRVSCSSTLTPHCDGAVPSVAFARASARHAVVSCMLAEVAMVLVIRIHLKQACASSYIVFRSVVRRLVDAQRPSCH